jgi:hypothetical protein
MSTLKNQTITSTYDQLIKRADNYSATGNRIELMNDSGDGVSTNLYLDAVNQRVGIGTGSPASNLHLAGTMQVGSDTSGHDVKLYGASSGAYMLWDSSQDDLIIGGAGRVGIGETSPAELLHIKGTSGIVSLEVEATTNDAVLKLNSDTDEGQDSEIHFEAGGTAKGSIEYDHHATDTSQKMNFKVGDNSTTAITILGDGKVGIGQNAPNSKLELSQAGNATIDEQHLLLNFNNRWGFQEGTSNEILEFARLYSTWQAVPMMAFNRATGDVGIGWDTPDTKLVVAETTNNENVEIKLVGYSTDGNTRSGKLGYCPDSATAANNYLYLTGSGNPALVVTHDDQVGIGTASPDSGKLLHLADDNSGAYMVLSRNETDGSITSNNVLGGLQFAGYENGGTIDYGFTITACAESAWTIGSAASTYLKFSSAKGTSGALEEVMRIKNNGYVGIGDANPGSPLVVAIADGTNDQFVINAVNNDASDPEGIAITFGGNTFTADVVDNRFISCSDDANVCFAVYSDGDAENQDGSFTAISDVRVKENIVDATSKLADLNKLKVRNFNFKNNPNRKRLGFIADEFEQVFPSMVVKKPALQNGVEYTDLKRIRVGALVPMLVKAIQELSAKVTALETKDTNIDSSITTLTNKDTSIDSAIAALTTRVAALESA